MNLVWDRRATHAHIDGVCVLSDEGNDGVPWRLAVTLSGGAGACAERGRVGTGQKLQSYIRT